MEEKYEDDDMYGVPAVYYLFDDINQRSSREVVEWIMDANTMDEKYEYLTLVINSKGGELAHALAIIDTMWCSDIPVRTVAMGEILSAGLMIFMSGDKGTRVIMPNTSIMSHVFSAGNEGTYHNLSSAQKEFKYAYDKMLALYMKTTGLTKQKVEKILLPKEDVWFNAEDAIKLGIADIIATSRQ